MEDILDMSALPDEGFQFDGWTSTLAPDSLGGIYEMRSIANVTSNISGGQLASVVVSCKESSRFYIQTLLAGSLSILGIVMNSVSIYVFGRDRDTNGTASILLRSLAVADSCFCASWIGAWSLPYLFEFLHIHRNFHHFWFYFRIYFYPFLFISQTAAIWMTVLIAASRFIAVCLPYRAPVYCTIRTTKISVVLVFVFAVLYNLPRFFEVQVLPGRPGKRPRFNRTEYGASIAYRFVYFDVMYYVFSFALPLLLLVVFNSCLIASYHQTQLKRAKMLSADAYRKRKSDKQERNITLVMIVVIIIFIICNIPARILQIISSSYAEQKCPTPMFYLLEFSGVLEVTNSTTNFFVYFIFRKQFRVILLQLTRSTTANKALAALRESREDEITKTCDDNFRERLNTPSREVLMTKSTIRSTAPIQS